MGNTASSKIKPQREDPYISPIIEAKSLLSNGDEAGAFAVLKKAAEKRNLDFMSAMQIQRNLARNQFINKYLLEKYTK
jgi:hypothetical protein